MEKNGVEKVVFSHWDIEEHKIQAYLEPKEQFCYNVVEIIHLKGHAPIFVLDNGFSLTFNADTLFYYSDNVTMKFYKSKH